MENQETVTKKSNRKIFGEVRGRDAIFPDFSGFPDFHKSKLSMKNL